MAANQSKFVNVVVLLSLIGIAGVIFEFSHIVGILVGEWQQAAILADAGDSVCVQYKRITDDPQHGIELLGQGRCTQ
jgi:hypothetical protein